MNTLEEDLLTFAMSTVDTFDGLIIGLERYGKPLSDERIIMKLEQINLKLQFLTRKWDIQMDPLSIEAAQNSLQNNCQLEEFNRILGPNRIYIRQYSPGRWKCEACKIDNLPGSDIFRHVTGKSHSKIITNLNHPAKIGLSCNICNIFTNSEKSWVTHVNGNKHKKLCLWSQKM